MMTTTRNEPTRAIAIGVVAIAITLMICGVIPDQPRAQARTPAQIIQTATPALPTLSTPAPTLAVQEAAPALIVSVPVSFDLAPVSAPENAAQEAAPPITSGQPAPTTDDADWLAAEQREVQAEIDWAATHADTPSPTPGCAPGVDNPVCDLPVLVFTNDPPAPAPVITDRDRAYSRARTR